MDSKKVIEIVKNIFKCFYGTEYNKTIDERMTNLVDIIFYKNHSATKKINTTQEYLQEYGINKYNSQIINKKIPFDEYVVEIGQQCTMIYEDNNNLKMIIYFPMTTSKKYNFDCILIHELLHVVDEHIIYQDNDNIISQGGFEKMCLKGEKKFDRNYEFLNEIIHQRIAEEINEYMYNNNIELINTKIEKVESIENYRLDRCEVIEKFYKTFKDKLLADKLLGNIDDFIAYVGENNFEKFNEWVKNFYSKYLTPKDRKEKSNTKEYIDNIINGINIIENMKMYSQSSKFSK